jgi:hypothetical protein
MGKLSRNELLAGVVNVCLPVCTGHMIDDVLARGTSSRASDSPISSVNLTFFLSSSFNTPTLEISLIHFQ